MKEIIYLTTLSILGFFISCQPVYAGPTDDNHIHVEQVSDGDNLNMDITQIGSGNFIDFSTAHGYNTFNFLQVGDGNKISWVPYWGSGANWGGDVDGVGNTENVIQYDGAEYGRHIWGDNNNVDIYQEGTHIHYLDIHADDVAHDSWQEGSGEHYSTVYYYGNTSNSIANIMQKGSGSHNIEVILGGTEPTTINLLRLGTQNQSYSLQQACYTVGGCTVNITQGD